MNTINSHYHLLRVSGRDHLDFLNRMLSSDVIGMAVDSVCPSALLAINGRVIATLILIRQQDCVDVLIHPSLVERVTDQLSQMRFRSDVAIDRIDAARLFGCESGSVPSPAPGTWALSRQGPACIIHWPDPLQLWIIESSDPIPEELASMVLSDDEWTARLIREGLCWITAQTTDHYIAQMIDLHHGPAISFRKGCFPGQEVVARIRYKGSVKRSLYRCQSDTVLPVGCSLNVGDRRLGEVINSAGTRALAVLSNRVDSEDEITEANSSVKVVIKRVHPQAE